LPGKYKPPLEKDEMALLALFALSHEYKSKEENQ